jgi:RNA polymerase-binding transcription factor DksA
MVLAAEVVDVRTALTTKSDRLRRLIAQLHEELSDVERHESPGREAASQDLEELVVLSDLIDRCRTELNDVNEALRRIADGTYGRCRVCGCAIDAERLSAIPETRFCYGCALTEGADPSWPLGLATGAGSARWVRRD